MPKGGARIGAGRKPKEATLAALHGHRPRPLVEDAARPPEPPLESTPPPEPVDPPAGLPAAVLKVWGELAPFALAERTLTRATVAAFEMLCRCVVLERKLSRGEARGGSNHRGMMQRVEAGFTRFRLAPSGKPTPAPKPADPFAEFATPPSTTQ